MENVMKFDDRYDDEQDFALAREVALGDFEPPPLEWDESEVSALVAGIFARHRYAD